MRIDKPAGDSARSDSSDRRRQIEMAIDHLQAALRAIDAVGHTPELGARVEECIHGLQESLDRDR